MSSDGKYVHRTWATTNYTLDELHKNLKTEHALAFDAAPSTGRAAPAATERLDDGLAFKSGRWTDRGLPR